MKIKNAHAQMSITKKKVLSMYHSLSFNYWVILDYTFFSLRLVRVMPFTHLLPRISV